MRLPPQARTQWPITLVRLETIGGERLAVDDSMIVRYENGASLPPLDRLIALAELYALTPAALLARHAAAVPPIAAIDRAEEAALVRHAALLDASYDGL
jgi:transcriptional regulator with XRE-family HTH domain